MKLMSFSKISSIKEKEKSSITALYNQETSP